MYCYRKLSLEQQREVVEERRLCGHPLHQPPRFESLSRRYLISAANFRASCGDETQRSDAMNGKIKFCSFLQKTRIGSCWAGASLPNHYHLVAHIDLAEFSAKIGRLHNGVSTQWNREDNAEGRKVWYRFSERGMRSERHLLVALNYVHFNAVKHGYVGDARNWPWCSLHDYLAEYGSHTLKRLWNAYPVHDLGKGWDWDLAK